MGQAEKSQVHSFRQNIARIDGFIKAIQYPAGDGAASARSPIAQLPGSIESAKKHVRALHAVTSNMTEIQRAEYEDCKSDLDKILASAFMESTFPGLLEQHKAKMKREKDHRKNASDKLKRSKAAQVVAQARQAAQAAGAQQAAQEAQEKEAAKNAAAERAAERKAKAEAEQHTYDWAIKELQAKYYRRAEEQGNPTTPRDLPKELAEARSELSAFIHGTRKGKGKRPTDEEIREKLKDWLN